MRVHLPSLPHTQTTAEYCWCAYTAKIVKFANMLTDLGHEVFLYSGEDNEARCAEHVVVVTDEEQERWFGDYDWNNDVFDGFRVEEVWWQTMNHRVIAEVTSRKQPGDILGVIAGVCQRPIAGAVHDLPCVEWGIGYAGVFAPYRVYESYAWMHHLAPADDSNIRWFDTVIPNSFDLGELAFSDKPGDYLLYLGRMTPLKGMEVLAAIAERTNLPLVTAGQGSERVPGAEHIGVVRGKEKADLLAGARALLAPTMYLEPFGGVAVEAMLSGTPAITTDYGGFTETVQDGVTGFRCRSLKDFIVAIDKAESLDRSVVRSSSLKFSTENVAQQYDRYLNKLSTLSGDGWYSLNP